MLATFGANVNDSGPGSLRSAILAANASPGPDHITIGVVYGSPPVLNLRTPLPAITEALVIEGYPSRDYIHISGASLAADADGLVLAADDVLVQGISLAGFRHAVVSSGRRNKVDRCSFTDNRATGVRVTGGSLVVSRSRVLGNASAGIDVGGDGPTPNDVPDVDGVPNYPTLTSARADTAGRVAVEGIVRGPANSRVVVDLFADTEPRTPYTPGALTGFALEVTTDDTGQAAFGGAFSVGSATAAANARVVATATYGGSTGELSAPFQVTAGGTAPLIVHSDADAGPGTLRLALLNANANPGADAIFLNFPYQGYIQLDSPLPDVTGPTALWGRFNLSMLEKDTFLVRVLAPTSGARVDGLRLLGGRSSVDGLDFSGFRHGIVLDGLGGNTVGKSLPVIVRDNSGDGVRVVSGTANEIGPRVISAYNGGLAVDVGADGPTPNDPSDADGGVNAGQNAPVVTSAVRDGTDVCVEGILDAAPYGAYRVDFYPYPAIEKYNFPVTTALGSVTVSTGADGRGTFRGGFAGSNVLGTWRVVARATDLAGNTSEDGPAAPVGYPAVVVTSDADAGPGTLRQAILDANASAYPVEIHFDLPGAGVHRIRVGSQLPTLEQPVIIDGSTQPGFAGTPVVELVGQADFVGLQYQAPGSGLRSLAVGGFDVGVLFDGAAMGSFVAGSYLGLDASGNALPNRVGVQDRVGAWIGGLASGEGNVISGNLGAGVFIVSYSFYSHGARVLGNLIGTNPAGTAAVPNDVGIDCNIEGFIQIGGATAAARNVISGNRTVGLLGLLGSGTSYVVGNYIGTDITGESPVPNGIGADFPAFDSGVIGGTVAAARNVISGNRSTGLRVDGAVVQGNYIGVSASGKPLGNGGHGVEAVGFTDIGGAADGAANVIAHNAGVGVNVPDELNYWGHPRVSVQGNAIYANAGGTFDLNADGPTPNDSTDADAGPNGLQNHPVLTAASATPNATQVSGALASKPNQKYRLDFYSARAAGPGGSAEAQVWLGSVDLSTDAAGDAPFSVTFPTSLPGQYVTATATATVVTSGDLTSELAAPRLVADAVPPQIVSAAFVFQSGPRRLVFAFTEDVSASLSAADLEVVSLADGVVPPAWALSYDALTHTATFTFASPLPDGDYRATLRADKVADPAGNAPGADVTLDFWHLAGDANRDRAVDFTDLATLAQRYNAATAEGWSGADFDADGDVDFADLVILAQNYNKALPPPPPPPTPPATARVFSTRPIATPVARRPAPVPAPPVVARAAPARRTVTA